MEPIHDEQSSGSQMNLAIKAFPWISLDDALRAPHGATVLVDASVYVDAHGVVRACRGAASSADAHCSPDEPTLGGLRGATAPPGTRIDGPLVVRVRGGALHDVLLTRD
jgi:hypothetical protein